MPAATRSCLPLLVLLAACARGPAPLERIEPNDNTRAAGTLDRGVLTLDLELRRGRWFPDGPEGPSVPVLALAERGKPLQVPGPMIRVPEGTTIRVRIRNTIADTALVLHGFARRPEAGPDSLVVPAGQAREVTFEAGAPGSYFYWGSTTGLDVPDRDGSDSQVGGALIVDPKEGAAPDRVFVLGVWSQHADTTKRPVQPLRETMTINGLAWPHTERLELALRDSVRWRVLNPTASSHPMHLHGVYFLVERRGDWRRDTAYAAPVQPRLVTELMLPGGTMTMRWAPERPGNWLFHCHFAFHVAPDMSLAYQERPPGTPEPHEHTAERAMSGLVLGMHVRAPAGWVDPADTMVPHEIRLLVQMRAKHYDPAPGYGFVVEEGRAPARDSIRIPGPTLVLERGRPVRITVVNHLDEATSVHWHGMEIPSWPDGVPGWSGIAPRLAPPIAPGDSFVAEFTPRRSGTFIYHTHADERYQLPMGLYGALLVVEPGTRPDPSREQVIVVGGDGYPRDGEEGLVNGAVEPPPVAVRAGHPFRLRLVSIHYGDRIRFRLLRDTTLATWRWLAQDGADLPAAERLVRPAEWLTGPGMTGDVEIAEALPGRLTLLIDAPYADHRWSRRVPIEVR